MLHLEYQIEVKTVNGWVDYDSCITESLSMAEKWYQDALSASYEKREAGFTVRNDRDLESAVLWLANKDYGQLRISKRSVSEWEPVNEWET